MKIGPWRADGSQYKMDNFYGQQPAHLFLEAPQPMPVNTGEVATLNPNDVAELDVTYGGTLDGISGVVIVIQM